CILVVADCIRHDVRTEVGLPNGRSLSAGGLPGVPEELWWRRISAEERASHLLIRETSSVCCNRKLRAAPRIAVESEGGEQMRKYVTEFIGTLILVFTIGCSVLSKQALAPIAIGAALMAAVYAGGHISGGHYNPAVSLAALVRGRLAAADLLPYWIAQLLGAAVASGLALFVINPPEQHPSALTGRALFAALVAEFIFT